MARLDTRTRSTTRQESFRSRNQGREAIIGVVERHEFVRMQAIFRSEDFEEEL